MKIAVLTVMLMSSLWADEVQKVLEKQIAEHGIPAMAMIAFDQEKIIAQKQVGVRQVGKKDQVTADDPWHIGSDGKAMTATLMARLVERDLVKWDTPLAEIFPKESRKFHPDARAITVTQLLSHTAGLPANVRDDLFNKARLAGDKNIRKQRLETVKVMLKAKPESKPGTAYLYSNTGYVIAGAVVEKLLKTTWEKAIVKEVFQPLGVKSVGFGAPDGRKAPRGHEVERSGKRRAMGTGYGGDNPALYGPAGGLYLSLADWALFAQEHLKGRLGKGKLLKKESYQKLHTTVLEDYALGWGTIAREGKTVVLAHDGSNTLWYARIQLDLVKGTGLCVVANDAGPKTKDAIGRVVKAGRKLFP